MPHAHAASHGHHLPEVDQPQTPALLVTGVIIIVLFGGGLWYKLHSKNSLIAERLAHEEMVRQQQAFAEAQKGSLGYWVLAPSVLCFFGLVYKCVHFSGRGQRQREENMKTGMIVAAIMSVFGVSLVVKMFLFPDKPPDVNIWSGLAENRTLTSALLMAAAAFGGYSIMSCNSGGRKNRHNRHRHHRRRAR